MKKTAFIAFMLVLLLGSTLVYGLVGSKLELKSQPVMVVSAAQQPAEFKRLQDAVKNRSLVGTAFQSELSGSAEDYQLVVYTVHLYNKGLVAADMAEMVISPSKDDVLCYTDGSVQGKLPSIYVPASGSASIRCVLLTKSPSKLNTVRDAYISYYVWGNPMTIKVTFS